MAGPFSNTPLRQFEHDGHYSDPRDFGRPAEPPLKLNSDQRRELAIEAARIWAQANNSRSPVTLAQGVLAVVDGVLNPKPTTPGV
jgi:hypothetical protein